MDRYAEFTAEIERRHLALDKAVDRGVSAIIILLAVMLISLGAAG